MKSILHDLVALAITCCLALAQTNAATLTTTWKDVEGTEHTVTTPVREPAGEIEIRRATTTHNRIVEAMQILYPPHQGMTWTLSVDGREWSLVA